MEELLRQKENMLVLLPDRLLKPFQRPFHIMNLLDRLQKVNTHWLFNRVIFLLIPI